MYDGTCALLVSRFRVSQPPFLHPPCAGSGAAEERGGHCDAEAPTLADGPGSDEVSNPARSRWTRRLAESRSTGSCFDCHRGERFRRRGAAPLPASPRRPRQRQICLGSALVVAVDTRLEEEARRALAGSFEGRQRRRKQLDAGHVVLRIAGSDSLAMGMALPML